VTLTVTVLAQTLIAAALNAGPVLAPVAAPELGFSAASVGAYAGFASLASLFGGSLIDGVLRRYGAIRTLQAALLMTAVALLLGATGSAPLVLLTAPIIGFASGMMVTASVEALSRVSPPQRAGLVYAVNQCSIPVGFGLSGVALPLLLIAIHWQAALLLLALATALLAILVQPLRASLDAGREPHAPLAGRALWAPLRLVWRDPRLRLLGWAGFALITVHMSIGAYYVTYLHLELGFSHVAAGTALLVSQLTAVAARIAHGLLLDRFGRNFLGLGILAIGTGLVALGFALSAPGWPYAAVLVLAVFTGWLAMGWNGMLYATVVRAAPEGRSGTAVGGAQGFTSVGGIAGPVLFAGLVAAIGYGGAFALIALVPIAMAVLLIRFDALERVKP
jgi:MFS family permease